MFQVRISDNNLNEIESQYFSYLNGEINENPFIGLPIDIKSASKKIRFVDYFVPIWLHNYDLNPIGQNINIRSNPKRVRINDLLKKYNGIIILSPPGSGKTTLLKSVLLQCVAPEISKAILDNFELDYFPLYLRCRDIKLENFNNFSEILYNLGDLSEIVELREEFKYYISSIILNKKCILIIDGLDEISEEQLRIKFIKYLLSFARKFDSVKILITSREPGFRILYDYTADNFEFVTIADLDPVSVNEITKKWYEVFVGKKEHYKKEISSLVSEILNTEHISEFAKNPLLLTTLLFLKRSLGIIPTNKTVLYDEAIKLLIKTWNVEGYKPLDIVEVQAQLSFLAYIMTIQGKNQIFHDNLLKILQQARNEMPDILDYTKLSVPKFIERVEFRSSLIILTGRVLKDGILKERYEFRHKIFQEYLTAFSIVKGYYPNRKSTDKVVSILEPYFLKDNWVEIIPMVAVLMGRDANQVIMALTKFIIKWEKRERKSTITFRHPSTRALFQCILNGAQINTDLVKETLTFLMKKLSISFKLSEKYLLLLKTKYKNTFIEIVESSFMLKDDLLNIGDLLARIYKIIYIGEVNSFPYKFIEDQLESKIKIDQIKGLLLLMIFVAESESINQRQKDELYNLGNKIENLILKSDEREIILAATWAMAHLLRRKIWTPTVNYDIYQRLLTLWVNEENTDIREMAVYSITILPVIDKVHKPFKQNQKIRNFILKILDIKDLHGFDLRILAALTISYYLEILEPNIFIEYLKKYLEAVINKFGGKITYDFKETILEELKEIEPLVTVIGDAGKDFFFFKDKIKNLKSGEILTNLTIL